MFLMASNIDVIVPLLGDLIFLLSFVLCLTMKDLVECALHGRGSAGGGWMTHEKMGVDLMGASLM